jgi:cyclic beta-1,2-glucan synthetase
MPSAHPASFASSLEPPAPTGRFLSNGSYTVLITSAGTGFSSFEGCRLNAWSGDRIEDRDGFFVYVRDVDRGVIWSAGRQPVLHPASAYEARWSPGHFAIERTDHQITTRMEICVSPDDPAELRKITLVNRSDRPRAITLTSYLEVVLASAASYAAHPAFSKLFIQTACDPRRRAVLATRRPRSDDERNPCLVHAVLEPAEIQHETDRARFLGRRRNASAPLAIERDDPLSGTTGNVLDPILSLRRGISLPPGASMATTFLLATADDPEAALALVERCAEAGRADELFARAGAQAVDRLRALSMSVPQAEIAEGLAAAMTYGHPSLRAAPEILARASGPLGDLEAHGLSRRRPYAVLHAESPAGARHLPELLTAHRYWRSLDLPIDLLVLDAGPASRESVDTAPGDAAVLRGNVSELSQADIDRIDAAAALVVTHSMPDLRGQAVKQPS